MTLRRLTALLVEERVLTASLVNRVDELNLLLQATQAMNSALDLRAVLSQIADSAYNLLSAGANDQESAHWFKRNVGQTLVAPMEVRGTLVGVISVTSGDSREPFTEFDLRGVSVFAEAAAASISNARAYEQQLGKFATLLAPEQVTRFAEIARGQGWRLDRLIENLLESSRSMQGALSISTAATDVGKTIRGAAVGLQRALSSHHIPVETPEQVLRWIDVDAVLRILDNLLSNAAKYSPEGTDILVKLSQTPAAIRLSVIDHGPGVDHDDLNGLFDKFTRGPDPVERGGLGLGLYVVKALAEAHGGRVEVDQTPGGGATFHVWLAAKQVDALAN
ncbi:MAG: GAF domain-containing sensor histidine kinase [Euzebya sp.]